MGFPLLINIIIVNSVYIVQCVHVFFSFYSNFCETILHDKYCLIYVVHVLYLCVFLSG